jgi:hypothetical protein
MTRMTKNGVLEFNPDLSTRPGRVWQAWTGQERVDRRLDVIDAAITLGRWRPYAAMRHAEPVQITLSEYPKYDDRQFTVIAQVTLTIPTGLHVVFGLKRGALSVWAGPAMIVEEYVIRYAAIDELMEGVPRQIAELRGIAKGRTLGE